MDLIIKRKDAMILKKIFKYDYLNKKRNFCLMFLCIATLIFFYLNIKSLNKESLCLIPFIILFALPAIYYSKKGILIDFQKNLIVVRDSMGKNCFNIDKIERAYIVEINKTNKGPKNPFILFIIGAKEEIEMWDYVYNNGKTYYIIFEIKNDKGGKFIYRSYFGWMYKEKSKLKVDSIIKELEDFINDINFIAKATT